MTSRRKGSRKKVSTILRIRVSHPGRTQHTPSRSTIRALIWNINATDGDLAVFQRIHLWSYFVGKVQRIDQLCKCPFGGLREYPGDYQDKQLVEAERTLITGVADCEFWQPVQAGGDQHADSERCVILPDWTITAREACLPPAPSEG